MNRVVEGTRQVEPSRLPFQQCFNGCRRLDNCADKRYQRISANKKSGQYAAIDNMFHDCIL